MIRYFAGERRKRLAKGNRSQQVMLAKGNRSQQVTDACKKHGGFYLGSIGGRLIRSTPLSQAPYPVYTVVLLSLILIRPQTCEQCRHMISST
ncbi:hypothetical protein LTSEUGA_2501 [Salmonella enterica subsp. enterica serovar Uganda str. R8-3404]|uniref:Fe-S hydro-lyase tartrate dehydratase beta-type catalytic domain-containing protein n=1 Tax=Salmonella enterica subsp. enterica serovar Uganda str. R8-3404 TaxID=913083 RepID=A0A6C8H3F0_SALET|nr:hypothetical protein LTSEUGA_2501 [Salmonella enterica subsp. enterica serovar Uganda str. R8-3404]